MVVASLFRYVCVCVCVSEAHLEANQMAIFLARSRLANSPAFSVNASCPSHTFTKHDTHEEGNMLLAIFCIPPEN